ncbi:hypothetical protein BdWA1_002260 [Babesia duncani]|uniref:Uncharacterized protein n=1 Tax=Babesia duncani TaxID=323732 RepID=A0AAD9PIX2_9APIC|nr:hypothetical protein BdWA1_002260 [Babesia duncani]
MYFKPYYNIVFKGIFISVHQDLLSASIFMIFILGYLYLYTLLGIHQYRYSIIHDLPWIRSSQITIVLSDPSRKDG